MSLDRQRKPSLTSWLVIAAFAAAVLLAFFQSPSSAWFEPTQNANSYVTCHQNNGEEAALYSQSLHATAGISCSRCHGGNASAPDKSGAHSGRFNGKLEPAQQYTTCGSCHSAEVAAFKTSKHFSDRQGVARLDCVQCHGAHMIGSPNRNFSYAYFCSGCHGLEYLPELNKPFQQMLMAADSENDAINEARRSGVKPGDEALAIRKLTRKQIAEIVHGTNYQLGQQRIPEILKQHEQFKLSKQ